jgi:hypothetical protein
MNIAKPRRLNSLEQGVQSRFIVEKKHYLLIEKYLLITSLIGDNGVL